MIVNNIFRDMKGRFKKNCIIPIEYRKKASLKKIGVPLKESTKIKLSLCQKGRKKWNMEQRKEISIKLKKAWKEGKYIKRDNNKISESLKMQYKKGIRKVYFLGYWKGKKNIEISLRNKMKWSDEKYRNKMSGENHYNWKGGITSFNRKLRCSSMWKIWRESVFLRDNFTCQNKNCEYCNNKIGVILHPHHIKPISLYPKLAFDISNGITYCKEYHINSKKLHKITEIIKCTLI